MFDKEVLSAKAVMFEHGFKNKKWETVKKIIIWRSVKTYWETV